MYALLENGKGGKIIYSFHFYCLSRMETFSVLLFPQTTAVGEIGKQSSKNAQQKYSMVANMSCIPT